MTKLTKNQKSALELLDKNRLYTLKEASSLVKEMTKTKFDASVDLDVRLGIDPRKSNQMVRGVVSLPHGTGKSVRVGVFARGDKAKEAEAAADRLNRGGWTAYISAAAGASVSRCRPDQTSTCAGIRSSISTCAPGAAASSPGTTWIDSQPLTWAELRGKVVMIDFWEYTCINCIRTFAENKKWYERYHKDGFEILGVHDPEFDIAYPLGHVRQAVKRFGLPYPIAVDDEFRIWRSYHNNTWPSRFLVDAQGVVRYHRDGEGGHRAFELARAGDIVLLAGKGTEQAIDMADGPIPWDERRVARELLRAIAGV